MKSRRALHYTKVLLVTYLVTQVVTVLYSATARSIWSSIYDPIESFHTVFLWSLQGAFNLTILLCFAIAVICVLCIRYLSMVLVFCATTASVIGASILMIRYGPHTTHFSGLATSACFFAVLTGMYTASCLQQKERETAKKVIRNRKALLIYALLSASVFGNILFIRELNRNFETIGQLNYVKWDLAKRLFFVGLERKTIDIYAWNTNKAQVFEDSGYRIRIIPLESCGNNLTSGRLSFLRGNAECIFLFASSQWEEKNDLAANLIELISPLWWGASRIMKEIDAEGKLSPYGQRQLKAAQEEYNDNLKRYGRPAQGE
jgi:hypothetical protein